MLFSLLFSKNKEISEKGFKPSIGPPLALSCLTGSDMRLGLARVWLARRGKQMTDSGPWLWLAKDVAEQEGLSPGREDAAAVL